MVESNCTTNNRQMEMINQFRQLAWNTMEGDKQTSKQYTFIDFFSFFAVMGTDVVIVILFDSLWSNYYNGLQQSNKDYRKSIGYSVTE